MAAKPPAQAPKSSPAKAPEPKKEAPKTQEQKKIAEINKLEDSGKITPKEAKDLKEQTRDAANKDGQLSNKESKDLNKQIDKDTKDKGSGKDDTGKGGGKSDGGKGDGGKGDGGKGDGGKGDGGKGNGGKGDGGKGDGGKGDGGKGNGKDDGKKDGISAKDLQQILNAIKELKKDISGLQTDIKEIKQDLADIDSGGGGGGNTKQDRQPSPADEGSDLPPTTRSSNRNDNKVEIPKPSTTTKVNVPEDSGRIDMPDINKNIQKEIVKITKELVNIAKDFIESGVDYSSIDYLPESEIITEDGDSLSIFDEYNAPPTESTLADERMDDITKLIQDLLNTGVQGTTQYNYSKFLDLFELKYNASGTAFFKLSIELSGAIIEDLGVIIVNDKG